MKKGYGSMLVSKSVTIGVDVIQVIDTIRLNHLIHTTRPPFSPICCSITRTEQRLFVGTSG